MSADEKTAMLREFLDGSLPPAERAAVEWLLEESGDAVTILNEQDKIETFVGRVREAIAMPKLPEERNDEVVDRLRAAVLSEVRPPAGETASVSLGDPSVSTDSQAPAASTTSLTFL